MNKAEKFFLVAFIMAIETCWATEVGLAPVSPLGMSWLFVAMVVAFLFIIWPNED